MAGKRRGLRLASAVVALLATSSCGNGPPRSFGPVPAPLSPPYQLPAGYQPFGASVPIPSIGSGCLGDSAPPDTGQAVSYVIPAHIDRQGSFGSEIFVGVCINGRGPFPFVVDTGATTSVIDAGLAARLGLVSKEAAAAILPCNHQTATTVPQSMSVAGVRLDPQTMTVGGLSTSAFPLMGILGVNVLSSFRAFRIDYAADTVSLLGPQTVGSAGSPSSAFLPSSFTSGTESSVPLTTFDGSGLRVMPVQIGTVPTTLLLDTGAQGTALNSEVAAGARLPEAATTSEAYAGLGCQIPVHYAALTAWQLGSLTLVPQPVAAIQGFLVGGGSLGSGTLEHYTPVVIDYQEGRLLLGPYGPVLASEPLS